MDEERYDVIIYEHSTRKISSVVGENMRKDSGHYNAEKRLETAVMRTNLDSYGVVIVRSGKYHKGDVLAGDAEVW